MATSSRSTLITKTHRILKKHYSPVAPPTDRTLLEHLLYGCCLENSDFEKADEAFALLQQLFFDWNEVRVTTVSELSQVMKALSDAEAAARRVKSSLQSVFESQYSYDLESLKKQNIGKAVKKLGNYKGVTPFVVAYVNQNALGGHAIAIDEGTLGAMLTLGIVSEKEAKKGHVPGLERAIPKNKGVEFASLVHHLGTAFFAAPFSPRLRSILLEINPQAKDRMPKRSRKRTTEEEKTPAKLSNGAKKTDKVKKTAAKTKTAKTTSTASKKKLPSKPTTVKKKKKTESRGASKEATATKKKPTSRQLARRKPR